MIYNPLSPFLKGELFHLLNFDPMYGRSIFVKVIAFLNILGFCYTILVYPVLHENASPLRSPVLKYKLYPKAIDPRVLQGKKIDTAGKAAGAVKIQFHIGPAVFGYGKQVPSRQA
jgi:hypothetical protein